MLKFKKFFSRYVFPIFFLLIPIKSKTIVFSSFGGRNYSGNPKVISDEILKSFPEYKVIWLFNDKDEFSSLPKIITANKDSFLGVYYLYTSKYWVDDSRKTIIFPKRKGQIYIQTWHGTPLKRIEFDAIDKLDSNYLGYAKKDSRSLDFLLSGNRYSSEIYQHAFNVPNSKIIEIGTPRNDELVATKIDAYDYISLNKIRILFAPTFRNEKNENGIAQLEMIDFFGITNHFRKLNKEVEFSVKFHPNVNKMITSDENSLQYLSNRGIKLISDGIGFDELFSATDVLITDYSSIFFDYALLKKPLILFNYDEVEYKKERGFYISLDELPVPTASTTQELEKILFNADDKFLNSSINLLNYIGNFEKGNSTGKVIEIINKG